MSLLQVAILNARWWASRESVRCIDQLRDVHRPRARTTTDSLNADVYVFGAPADRAAQPSLANPRLPATIIDAQPPLGTATGPTRAGRHAVPPLVTVSSQTSLCRPSETSAHAEMSESDHAIGQARYRSWCDDGPRFALADSGDRRNTRRLEELRWQGEVGRDRATPRLRHAIRQARRAQRSLHPAAIKVWLHCLERHL